MRKESEHRSFAIGQEIGWVGRLTRLALGLLGLGYVAMNVSQATLSIALIGQLTGGALLMTTLYVVAFWVMGERVLARLHPWMRTGMFWSPLALIPFLFLIPWGWGSGVLLYMSVALIVGALTSYGGCEVVALPSFLFRRRYVVYCPLNAIDLVERRYAK